MDGELVEGILGNHEYDLGDNEHLPGLHNAGPGMAGRRPWGAAGKRRHRVGEGRAAYREELEPFLDAYLHACASQAVRDACTRVERAYHRPRPLRPCQQDSCHFVCQPHVHNTASPHW